MAFELVYTSVPRGLRPGSSGFCIVAYTNGLAANLALLLEGMSAYKAHFPPYDPNASKNPIAYTHYIYRASGLSDHLLGRIAFYGLDYTKRSNKLAHHLVLSESEAESVSGGPTAVFAQKGLFRTAWNEEPKLFRSQVEIHPAALPLQKAKTWEQYTGDAGWAGELVQYYCENPEKTCFIVYDPLIHTNILGLVQEALLLLPEKKRWEVSFNTYFLTLPAGMRCCWRFCVAGSDALREARRIPNTFVLDLTKELPPAGKGPLQTMARTGMSPIKFQPARGPQNPVRHSNYQENSRNMESARPLQQVPEIREREKHEQNCTESKKSRWGIFFLFVGILLLGVAAGAFWGFSYVRKHVQKIQSGNNSVSVLDEPNSPDVRRNWDASSKEVQNPSILNKQNRQELKDDEEVVDRSAASSKVRSAAVPAKKNPPSGDRKAEQQKKSDKKSVTKGNTRKKTYDPSLMFWSEFGQEELLKPGGKWISKEDFLRSGEQIVALEIFDPSGKKENYPIKEDHIVELSKNIMGIGEGHIQFKYKIEQNGQRISVQNLLENATEYKIVSVTTDRKRTIHLTFVPGVTMIPSKKDSSLKFQKQKEEPEFRIVYIPDDHDKDLLKKNPDLFDDIKFRKLQANGEVYETKKVNGEFELVIPEYSSIIQQIRKLKEQKRLLNELNSEVSKKAILEDLKSVEAHKDDKDGKKTYDDLKNLIDLCYLDGKWCEPKDLFPKIQATLEKEPLKKTLRNLNSCERIFKVFDPEVPLPSSNALKDRLNEETKELNKLKEKFRGEFVLLLNNFEKFDTKIIKGLKP